MALFVGLASHPKQEHKHSFFSGAATETKTFFSASPQLASVLQNKPPISERKIGNITRLALANIKVSNGGELRRNNKMKGKERRRQERKEEGGDRKGKKEETGKE
jgi:hypothetical protein